MYLLGNRPDGLQVHAHSAESQGGGHVDEKLETKVQRREETDGEMGSKINLTESRRWNQLESGIFPPHSGELFEVREFGSNSPVVQRLLESCCG